jgi:hypothetical protein
LNLYIAAFSKVANVSILAKEKLNIYILTYILKKIHHPLGKYNNSKTPFILDLSFK